MLKGVDSPQASGWVIEGVAEQQKQNKVTIKIKPLLSVEQNDVTRECGGLSPARALSSAPLKRMRKTLGNACGDEATNTRLGHVHAGAGASTGARAPARARARAQVPAQGRR
eukprot:6176044-Pleurochrysis_carterae.AAC.1